MKKVLLTVVSNRKLAVGVYEMKLSGDVSAITNAGQFVDFAVRNCYLRRPISVCDVSGDTLTVIYKAVGKGTDELATYVAGESIDTLTGLGNGYDLACAGSRPLLVGGGVGVPPMYKLCKDLVKQGKKPIVVLGFNTKTEIFYEDEFKSVGAEVHIATADGSYGVKGFVTDVIKDLDYTYFYACGPKPMFYALEKTVVTDGEYSLEERMGCGFGACLGCTIETKNGAKRVCKDGPVFKRSEIIW